MNRIETICSYINSDDKVVDVGCDQVEVGILLSKRNIKSIASDTSENVIKKAKEKINNLNLNDYIDLRVSDGLIDIKTDEVDTLVLAGMGTHTILDILSKTDIKFKKIITISNNYHDTLRLKMKSIGYKIFEEQIIKERNKYYNLILFVPGKQKLSEKELLLGFNHKNKVLYEEYLLYLKNKYIGIKCKTDNNEKINLILKYLTSNN